MKDIATARKSKGDYGRFNLGQYPLLSNRDRLPNNENLPLGNLRTPGSPLHRQRYRDAALESGNSKPRNRQEQNAPFSGQHVSLRRIPCSGLLLSEGDFLLLKLVPLTGLRLGITTSSHLRSRTSKNRDHFTSSHLGTRKLLTFIPSRYHEVPLLRYATICVTVKLRQMLQGLDCWSIDGEALVLSHYNRAVKALRIALEDENDSMAPETLCAVELLSAFEVCESRRVQCVMIPAPYFVPVLTLSTPTGFKQSRRSSFLVTPCHGCCSAD